MSRIVDEITENIRKMREIVGEIDASTEDMRQFLDNQAAIEEKYTELSRPEARIRFGDAPRLKAVR